MNVTAILDCLPCGLTNNYALLGLLVGVISLVTGIFCFCTGSKGLGAFLVGAPLALLGLFYLWASLQ